MKTPTQLMTARDAAAYLDLSESRMLATGLPRFNVKGKVYFAIADVTAARRARKDLGKRSTATNRASLKTRKADFSGVGVRSRS